MQYRIWNKCMVIGFFIILLISNMSISCAISNEETSDQTPLNKETINPLNPRYFYDVDVLIISRLFDITELDGFHEKQPGNGIDAKITLFGEYWWPVHIFILWKDSEIIQRGEGDINAKIEFFNYDGWMFGHITTPILPMIPLKLYGHCDVIKITTYRG